MPQIQKTENGKSPIQTQVRENLPFQLRLRKKYKATDYVRVINIDTKPFWWEYFPVDGEESYFQDNGATRIIEGRPHFDEKYEEMLPGNEQAWVLNPGESEVLLGANADLFIMGLYRTVKAKRTIKQKPNMKEGEARKFNYGDGRAQEDIINEIFIGIEEPVFGPVQHGTETTTSAK